MSHICVVKNSPHFPSDAYMRRKSLYFSYSPRGRPRKQCQAKMSIQYAYSKLPLGNLEASFSYLHGYGRGLCISLSNSFFFRHKLYIDWNDIQVVQHVLFPHATKHICGFSLLIFLCRCSVTPNNWHTQDWLATNRIDIREPNLFITLSVYSSLDPL